jgi:hypothetical protein
MDDGSRDRWASVVGFGDDTRVEVTGRPAQGTRHEVLLGRDVASGDDVVIKLERVAGALEIERCALMWLTAHAGPASHLRSAARTRQAEALRDSAWSAISRAVAPPQSEQGWERVGVALAGLSDLALARMRAEDLCPCGVRLARAMFIALLGVGPTGYRGRDHVRRSRAVSEGYLANLGCSWTPGPSTPETRERTHLGIRGRRISELGVPG